MLCQLHSATIVGIDAVPVDIEVHVSGGIPGFFLVGLGDGAVKEGSVRIRAAIDSCKFDLKSSRVTVNLAPADLRKDGAAFDLPIALGVLGARGLIKIKRNDWLIAGELALDGRVRPIRGVLSLAHSAKQKGRRAVLVPAHNAPEAAVVEGIHVYGVTSLHEAIELVTGAREGCSTRPQAPPEQRDPQTDFAEVCGQNAARRAAEVAAAGGHNLMLVGPPGAGKTMIARRLAGVLPQMSRDEAVETTKVHSVAGLLSGRPLIGQRPFRAPHHTCSSAGLIGGGSKPRPGEVSLAHNGVLFLDELPEFQRATLEALRQPLESGHVTIVRARQAVTYPSRFMLVAAMNPCPCGYWGSDVRTCTCGERAARRYLNRISGPLIDRFDLFVRVGPVATSELLLANKAESSHEIAKRVGAARTIQRKRLGRCNARCNAQIRTQRVWRDCDLTAAARSVIEAYGKERHLSARSVHRSCRVARTLADLDGASQVEQDHVALALSMQGERWLM